MVVVDRLSKSAHFIPLKHPYTTASVAHVFIREIVRLHGIPRSIISDRDKVFIGHFWWELFKNQGTTLKRSTAYHPQTDGHTEVVNRSVETYLRCFSSERQKEWVRWLPWAEYWYNTSYHSGIRTTPFKVLYGREPPPLVKYDHGTAVTFEVDRYLQDRDRTLCELRHHLSRAQQLMKDHANEKRRDVSFSVGERVFLKLRPYRQTSVRKRVTQKLAPRFYGPFEVLERIGQVAYRLQLPPTSSIHPVFHVSQLKRAAGPHMPVSDLPDSLAAVGDRPVQPTAVLGVRESNGQKEVLVQWTELPETEATWEPYDQMRRQFPLFHLEDKVTFKGAGNDVIGPNSERWGLVYERRKKKSK